MKGNLDHVNAIPNQALPPAKETNVWGSGFTPEGIDQNPVYYEFVLEDNWRSTSVPNVTAHIQARSHRRYGIPEADWIDQAWSLLVER